MFMSVTFKHLIQDRIVKKSYTASVFILFLTLIYAIFAYSKLPPFLPLFNQLTWGAQRLGDKYLFFVPLIVSSILIILNMFFSKIVYEKMPLVVRMIGITSFFISIITCIFVIRTTLLVF